MSNVDGYRGDVSALEAWETLREEPRAQLVDVRTEIEWTRVGVPDLADVGRSPVFVEWQRFPDMAFNTRFLEEVLAGLAERDVRPDTPLLFLCRSGVRSAAAADVLAREGFGACFNVADGFEGGHGPPGAAPGWKASGLPWRF